MNERNSIEPLTRGDRLRLVLLLLAVIGFGVVVEYRSALSKNRMGDVGVYLRAGWAVRADRNIYDIKDDHFWHYCYPPFYAICMTPLADPPKWLETAGFKREELATAVIPDVGYCVPFAVSVGICFVMNLVFLVLGVHWLASALEQTSLFAARGPGTWHGRRWWFLRLIPIIACIHPLGCTLIRGQVNILVMACICGMIAGMITGKRFRAGLCLAGAICIKIIPAYLILVPLVRRDGRCLAGCTAGLLVGLVLLPGVVMGPEKTVEAYRDLAKVTVGPALGLNKDTTRAGELIDANATDNQAYMVAIHNTLHRDRSTRPAKASPLVRKLHWGLACAFTLITLAVAWRHRNAPAGANLALFAGGLSVIMALTSPVCHTHYFAVTLPLVMGLVFLAWEKTGWRGWIIPPAIFALTTFMVAAPSLASVPGLKVLKDLAVPMYVNMTAWGIACVTLVRMPRPCVREEGVVSAPRLAA